MVVLADDHDLGRMCRGRRIQIFGQSDFGIFPQNRCIFHFDLGISGYCISCLSCAARQSGDDIHDICCCLLRCWWSLFSEYCVRPWIIFQNITSEYDAAFVLLILRLQLRILEMTEINQRRKMNFFASSITSFLFLTLSAAMLVFPKFFPFFHCFFCIQYFNAWGIGRNLCLNFWWLSEFILFAAMWS